MALIILFYLIISSTWKKAVALAVKIEPEFGNISLFLLYIT